MAYSKKALVDLIKSNGNADIHLASKGTVTATCNFQDEQTNTATIAVTIHSYISGDTKEKYHSFRYLTDVYGEIEIMYYGDDNDAKECKQTIIVYPNNYYERSSALPMTYKIPILSQYISAVTFTLFNNTKETLTVTKALIRREVSSAEEYSDATGISNTQLSKVEAYDNGCQIYYTDQDTPTTLVFEGDSNGRLTGVIVNPNSANQRRIEFNRNSTSIT